MEKTADVRKRLTLVMAAAAIFLLMTVPLVPALENGPLLNSVKKITNKEIVNWARDPIVVNAVKDANKKAARSADEIARLDAKWMATEGVDEWIGGFIKNPCADYLRGLQGIREGKITMYPEIFVMDKQGCVVAETNRTSDYLQGDEDKFIKSFANGQGAIFIDEPTFDESSRTYSVQVSVPVIDPDTKTAIGAMTVGIDLDALGQQALER